MSAASPVEATHSLAAPTSIEKSAVGPRYGRTRNRRARERALLLAAGKLFASRGYDATTTREIAAAAGCAEGLIHRYFQGKAGLLLALIRLRASREVVDLTANLQCAGNIEDEIVQLVDFEVEHMWNDREFLRVVIPRALFDADLGPIVSRIGPAQRAKAITARLRKYPPATQLPETDLEALADAIGVIGFMYGFMRPVVLGHDHAHSKKTALTVARLLARNLQRADSSNHDSMS